VASPPPPGGGPGGPLSVAVGKTGAGGVSLGGGSGVFGGKGVFVGSRIIVGNGVSVGAAVAVGITIGSGVFVRTIIGGGMNWLGVEPNGGRVGKGVNVGRSDVGVTLCGPIGVLVIAGVRVASFACVSPEDTKSTAPSK